MPDLSIKTASPGLPSNEVPLVTYATLIAGCEFVSRFPAVIETYPVQGSRAVQGARGLAAKVHMRVTANRIRELDRFLAVMLNEAAGRIGGAAHDAEQFDRISNTSKKLQAVEMLFGMVAADHGRLRAMGRIAARLRGASHHWRADSLTADLGLAGVPAGAGEDGKMDLSHGKALIPLSFNLATISAFYQSIGQRLAEEMTNKNYAP